MLRRGITYLNSNRKQAGLFLEMSAADNMACPNLGRLSHGGHPEPSMNFRYAQDFIDKFNIAIPGPRTQTPESQRWEPAEADVFHVPGHWAEVRDP